MDRLALRDGAIEAAGVLSVSVTGDVRNRNAETGGEQRAIGAVLRAHSVVRGKLGSGGNKHHDVSVVT